MICPQTKMECIQRLGCDAFGCYTKKSDADADILASERARSERAELTATRGKVQPPPTLADIERLVHEHETKAISYYKYGANADEANLRQSRAALMAAIRLYVQE